jgi:hypothetical protein
MSTIGYEHHPIRAARQPYKVSDNDTVGPAERDTGVLRPRSYLPRVWATARTTSSGASFMAVMHRLDIRYPPRAVDGVASRGGQVSSAGRSDARNRRVPSTH